MVIVNDCNSPGADPYWEMFAITTNLANELGLAALHQRSRKVLCDRLSATGVTVYPLDNGDVVTKPDQVIFIEVE